MVSNDLGPIEIPMVLRDEAFRDRINKDQMLLDEFTRKEAAVRKKFHASIRGMMNTMRSLTGLFRMTMSYFGQTLDPIQEAIVTSIYTSLTAILAMHRALEASTVGVAGVVTIGLSALAMGMSIVAIGAAHAGMADAKAQTDKTMNLLIQMESLITTSQVWM